MATRKLSAITTIVVHCADTPDDKDFSAADIDRWHKERGFRRNTTMVDRDHPLDHIGYHYVITRSGDREFGRQLKEVGAHARGHNTNSIGICLIGREQFTPDQLNELRHLIDTLQYSVAENSGSITSIVGHCDLDSKKTCPNFDVAAWLVEHPNQCAVSNASGDA